QFEQTQLTLLWETDSSLLVPESVLPDLQNQVLYVSNIDGKDPWGTDGKGSIARLSYEGKILEREWVKGLNAPKGMGILNGKLYVDDINSVVVIDIKSGTIDQTIHINSAKGLNDVAVSADGKVYISDSNTKVVYEYADNAVKTFL